MAQNTYVELYGMALVYGTAGGTPATAIAGIKKVRGLPKSKMSKIDITRIDQASRAEQSAPSMYDPGKFQFTLALTKADYATLIAIHAAGTLKSWKVTLSNASTDQADGWIEEMGMAVEDKGEVLVDIDIQISGAKTFTA